MMRNECVNLPIKIIKGIICTYTYICIYSYIHINGMYIYISVCVRVVCTETKPQQVLQYTVVCVATSLIIGIKCLPPLLYLSRCALFLLAVLCVTFRNLWPSQTERCNTFFKHETATLAFIKHMFQFGCCF